MLINFMIRIRFQNEMPVLASDKTSTRKWGFRRLSLSKSGKQSSVESAALSEPNTPQHNKLEEPLQNENGVTLETEVALKCSQSKNYTSDDEEDR